MTNRGLCTEKCEDCALNINQALMSIDPKVAKKIDAVYIWQLRRLYMARIEEASERSKNEGPSAEEAALWE
jgi:hypothetical protein